MPRNYLNAHKSIGDWKRDQAANGWERSRRTHEDADKYDSTNPNFLKRSKLVILSLSMPPLEERQDIKEED